MKIAILNGSPRKENTAAMVDAFKAGAEETGNEVCVLHVGRMKINGCLLSASFEGIHHSGGVFLPGTSV